jgi:hypothetical protein
MSSRSAKKREKLRPPDLPSELAMRCVCCGQPFTDANVYSAAGWLEVAISGICEVCFDTLADIPPLDGEDDDPLDDERSAR